MRVISVEEMRRLEAEGMAAGVSGYDMMRLAGEHAAEEIMAVTEPFPKQHRKRFAILCGKGNNGGDGWVVARKLHEAGKEVRLYSLCQVDELKADARRHAEALPEACWRTLCPQGVPQTAFEPGTILVDALLGTGVTGSPRGSYADTIRRINASGLPVVAVDIPSGVNGDTGEGKLAVQADWTVTMGLPKQGLFLAEGAECSGTVRVVDIGLPLDILSTAICFQLDGLPVETFACPEARRHARRRPASGFKNSFGHVACFCGSGHYGGAAELCAAGAMRAGAGLVTLVTPGGCRPAGAPLASVIRRQAGDGGSQGFDASCLPAVQETLRRATAAVYGPGTGQLATPGCLEEILRSGMPVVVDADGLRLLAAHENLLHQLRGPAVLTPHPGEMRALLQGLGMTESLGDGLAERVRTARAVARRTNCVVLLKGRFSIVAEPEGTATVNLSGDASLGTAGSGDVLAGVIGALLGQGMPAGEAARMGAFLHGLAGELRTTSARGLVADDLPLNVAEAWRELSPLA